MSNNNEGRTAARDVTETNNDGATSGLRAVSMRVLGAGLVMAGTTMGAIAGTLSVSEEVELKTSPDYDAPQEGSDLHHINGWAATPASQASTCRHGRPGADAGS